MNQGVTDFIIKLNQHGLLRWMPDKQFLQLIYYCRLGKRLDLKNPKTFNEKLQWIKLYDRRPEYTTMVDKYLVKDYVANLIGEQYIIPTLGVWDKFEDIDFTKLPNQFVLKCTHDSGGLVICRDKSKFNVEKARGKINGCLKKNYYWHGREWPYKNVKPRIIAEKYMEDSSSKEINDYKVFNFNGIPKVILVCRDRFKSSGLTEDFYSTKWEHLDIKRPNHPNADECENQVPELDEMLRLSEILSKDMSFVRTDFYTIDNRLYFGEITLFPASGLEGFIPNCVDKQFGDWIILETSGGGYNTSKE